jgi:hypothetical protein
MTELTNLIATPKADQPSAYSIRSQRLVTAAVHVETHPGTFIHVTLDEKGLLIARGEEQAHISLGALITLAVQHVPRLALIQPMVEAAFDAGQAAPPPTNMRNE